MGSHLSTAPLYKRQQLSAAPMRWKEPADVIILCRARLVRCRAGERCAAAVCGSVDFFIYIMDWEEQIYGKVGPFDFICGFCKPAA